MTTCMPCPEDKTPAATCLDRGAVSTFQRPTVENELNRSHPAPSCDCRCHQNWRFVMKKPAAA